MDDMGVFGPVCRACISGIVGRVCVGCGCSVSLLNAVVWFVRNQAAVLIEVFQYRDELVVICDVAVFNGLDDIGWDACLHSNVTLAPGLTFSHLH